MNVQKTNSIGGLAAMLCLCLVPGSFAAGTWVRLDNGKDLTGWKVCATWHGNGGKWEVHADSAIWGTQNGSGQGGYLATNDLTYTNYELVLEGKPHYRNDSGIFLRAKHSGECYQIVIDYYANGNIGSIYGEGISCVGGFTPPWNFISATTINRGCSYFTQTEWATIFKTANNDAAWNKFHVGIIKNPPRIKVWCNGRLINDWQGQVANCTQLLNNGATGAIGVQVHGGSAWETNTWNGWRKIYVKQLSATDTIQGPGPNNDPYNPVVSVRNEALPVSSRGAISVVCAGGGVLKVAVSGQASDRFTVELSDPAGRIVRRAAGSGTTVRTIPLAGLSRGFYMARIHAADKTVKRAVIVDGR